MNPLAELIEMLERKIKGTEENIDPSFVIPVHRYAYDQGWQNGYFDAVVEIQRELEMMMRKT